MDIVKTAQNVGTEIEKGVEVAKEKVSEVFNNIASHLPFANLAKKEDSTFHLEVDLPGVNKEDIKIQVEDNILTISAIRHFKNELTRDNYYVCESAFGKLERKFVLPESVDTKKVSAEYNDGRLVVELEKTAKAKPKTIAIK